MNNLPYDLLGKQYLDKYKINLCPRITCTCWSRPHAHGSLWVNESERKICKMDLPKTRLTLFDFLHEVGHIVHPQGGYKGQGDKNGAKTRSLAEFNATQWAIAEMKINDISIPRKKVQSYNRYIRDKIARGLRRGLKKVPSEIRHLRPRYW